MYNQQGAKQKNTTISNTPKYDISLYYLAKQEEVNRVPKTAIKQMQQQVQRQQQQQCARGRLFHQHHGGFQRVQRMDRDHR